jgi:hypothetical protein
MGRLLVSSLFSALAQILGAKHQGILHRVGWPTRGDGVAPDGGEQRYGKDHAKYASRGTKTVQWDATHQGSNHGARTFSYIFQDLPTLCFKW